MKQAIPHEVARLHQVRNEIGSAEPEVNPTAARRTLGFLKATVESTERLAALASDAFGDDRQRSLIPLEDFSPTVADFARSMILFAGAGIDATLKQLLRDCLAESLNCNPKALDEFRKYVEREIERDTKKSLAKWLVARDMKEALIDQYLSALVEGSMQSTNQIERAVNAIGISVPKSTRQAFSSLFEERNVIAHELDLLDAEVHGTSRRQRLVEDAWRLADDAYAATLDIVLVTARALREYETNGEPARLY